jgi:hypothetical protein
MGKVVAAAVGIPIRAESFRALVADYLSRMDSGAEMTTEDYIKMTRLWNTIELGRLGSENPLFHRYSTTFFPAYVERISRSIGANPTKGMALYSKEHDLYIGGKPHPNSQYRFDEQG